MLLVDVLFSDFTFTNVVSLSFRSVHYWSLISCTSISNVATRVDMKVAQLWLILMFKCCTCWCSTYFRFLLNRLHWYCYKYVAECCIVQCITAFAVCFLKTLKRIVNISKIWKDCLSSNSPSQRMHLLAAMWKVLDSHVGFKKRRQHKEFTRCHSFYSTFTTDNWSCCRHICFFFVFFHSTCVTIIVHWFDFLFW